MEYRYITQETIDSGGRNITSPEMFEEARKYNTEAVKNQNRRARARRWFNAWIVVQFFLLFFSVTGKLSRTTMEQYSTHEYTPDWQVWLGVLGLVAYIGLIVWFVFLKHNRNCFILALISLPVLAVSLGTFYIPIGNFIMGWYYSYVEDQLSKELGYPSFPRLNVTTVNSDADSITNLTYDSIREKANRDHPHDGTFL